MSGGATRATARVRPYNIRRSHQGDRKGTPSIVRAYPCGRPGSYARALEVMRVPWKPCACPGSHARALEVMRFPSRNTGAPLLDAWKLCACPGSHSLVLEVIGLLWKPFVCPGWVLLDGCPADYAHLSLAGCGGCERIGCAAVQGSNHQALLA